MKDAEDTIIHSFRSKYGIVFDLINLADGRYEIHPLRIFAPSAREIEPLWEKAKKKHQEA